MITGRSRAASSRPIARYCLWFASAIMGLSLFAAPHAFADQGLNKLVTLDIPPQRLDTALMQFATQADMQVMLASKSVADQTTAGIKGTLQADAALAMLLSNSGMSYTTANGTVTVAPAPSAKHTEGPDQNSFRVAQTGKKEEAEAGQQDVTNVKQSAVTDERKTNKELDEIVVTGTNIRGAAPVGATIRTLDRIEIEESGYTTTQDLIQSLPQNFRGGAAGASADGSNFSAGANSGYNNSAGSGVNLRGLGNTATLVLVNGHRVASSGNGYFTDISTIPLSAIDHIDVLTDGASAIYGSDAIAGVVNIVLKKDSQGLETGARYDFADSRFSTYGGNIQVGNQWSGGGFTLGGDFTRQSDLDASERSFTESVVGPTSILPGYHQTALSAAAQQHLADRLEIHGDAQYTDKLVTINEGAFVGPDPFVRVDTSLKRWSASVGTSFALSGTWILRYDASGGQEVDNIADDDISSTSPASRQYDDGTTMRFTDQTVGVSGDVVSLPAGPVKLAVGADYRTEKFLNDEVEFEPPPAGIFDQSVGRNIKAAYGEIRVPIVGDQNSVHGVHEMTISVAGRIDDYSDFGTTVNPKYGVSWFPVASLQVRGAYSTSFRAPATGTELLSSVQGTQTVAIQPFPGPAGSAPVPVVELFGGAPNLQPERARNITFGVDWNPVFVPDLHLEVNYYDISYKNQLAVAPYSSDPINTPAFASIVTYYPSNAPLSALVNTAIANGAFFLDETGGAFGPNPLAVAQYLYDIRTRNLSTTDTSGFDLTARYHVAVGTELIDTRFDATRIDKFSTAITPSSPQISEVNTVGYPARLRLRELTNWTHGLVGVSIAANYVGSYPDTSAPSARDVSSYTTIDVAARYSFRHGIKLSAAATNVFNRLPPYVYSGTPFFQNSHYDPANASPLGRLISLNFSKSW